MATIKPTTSVSFDNSTVKVNDNFQLFLKNNLYKQFENQNLIRQFDLSTLERLMDSTLSNQHLNWLNDANLLNNSLINNEKLEIKQNNIRKSSRGSEEEDLDRSGISNFELIDDEMISSEQSAFLNNVSNLTSQLSQSNHFSLNQNLNDDNSTIESSNDNNLLIENQDSKSSDNEFDLNKLTRSQSSRRKSSSRLARQIGDGTTKSCHLCTFVTENKLEYQAHMDKHYEHRCKRCGYGCRTKGRLNRHIRESHPDLANELESGDGKRKKRNHNNSNKSGNNLDKYGNSLEKVVSFRNHIPTKTIVKKDENLNIMNDLSNEGSDSTIINDSLDQSNNSQIINQQLNESLNNYIKQENSTITQSKLDNQQSNKLSLSLIKAEDVSEHSQLSSSAFEQENKQKEIVPSDESKLLRYRRYTCKQCSHVSTSKKESWDHGKIHIKQDKLLVCEHPNCGFSTGYKHHLEYHLRKHFKHKPYNCIKCSYTCINKSMLASHLKSHSNVYQFRCENCPYATKYMHSLKQHLRKYNHKPDRILNLDGSENPYPIIDVYGTRRGPRPKKGVGSLKLIKQVLSDNNHLAVDPDKVEKIVNTLTEQNPEEGDEKLFSLMRSNKEKDVQVDIQLHQIINEQLKANASTQMDDTNASATANLASSIKSLLNQQQQQQQQQQQKQSNQQIMNKNQNLAKASNKSPNQSASVNFIKEKGATCSTSVLSKLNSFCKSPKKSDQNKANDCLTSLNNETDEQSNQLSKSILNNLFVGEHGFALARSLLNPSLFNGSLLNPALLNSQTNLTNEKETKQLDNYSGQLLTNQFLHNHLLTQFKNEQHQLNKELNNNEIISANNFVAQLAFNLALNGQQQTNSINFNNNNNNLNLLNHTSQEWAGQLTNHLINNGLLNPAIFNINLPNLLNQTIFNQNLLNSRNLLNNKSQNSSPDLLNNDNVANNNDISNNFKNLTSTTATNSIISNWQSYLTSLLLNKSTNNNNLSKLTNTNNPMLINTTNTITDNNQLLNMSAVTAAAKNLTTQQQANNNQISIKQEDVKLEDNKQKNDIFISNSTNSQNQQKQQQQQQKTISSQSDLNLVLSSIEQVFTKSTATSSSCLPSLSTSLPTISNNNQSSEFDLSTILGYSMLMKMQQQFTTSLEQQQKKLKENN